MTFSFDRVREAVDNFRAFEEAPAGNPIAAVIKALTAPLRAKKFFSETLYDIATNKAKAGHDDIRDFQTRYYGMRASGRNTVEHYHHPEQNIHVMQGQTHYLVNAGLSTDHQVEYHTIIESPDKGRHMSIRSTPEWLLTFEEI